jgi:hypothetical protein
VLVPALVLKIGPRVWWPSALAKIDGDADGPGADGRGRSEDARAAVGEGRSAPV